MKIDAMTMGAVGFAAWAAWTYLKKPTAGATAQKQADIVFGSASAQRYEIGNNLWQNLDYMGGGQGLKPTTGFWAV